MTSSHDQPSTNPAAKAAVKKFSKSADIGSLAKPPEENTQNDDDMEMDWGGCDNWDGGEGVEGEAVEGEGVRPQSDETAAAWDNWDDDIGADVEDDKIEEREEPMPSVKEEGEEKRAV